MAKAKPALKPITARRVQGVAVVARRIGCSPEHLSYVLHGHRKPNEKIRRGLARLGVTCTVDGTPLNPPSPRLRRTRGEEKKGGR